MAVVPSRRSTEKVISSGAKPSFPLAKKKREDRDDIKIASTFTDSAISSCKRLLASSGVNVSEELMFLSLVKLFGVIEAKIWSDLFHFKSENSYRLLSRMFLGTHAEASAASVTSKA
jgi:hypothetical protein